MKVSDVCKNYFSGFHEVSNFKNNDNKITALAILKILSYFTAVIPLGFAAVYGAASLYNGAASLYGRVNEKQSHSTTDMNVHDKAKNILDIDNFTSGVNPKIDLPELSKVELSEVLMTYNSEFIPHANLKNLLEYSKSEDYKRHAKTARIYYNASQLTELDALKIVFQREPTNIAMEAYQYKEENLKELFGYKKGVYNDSTAKKTNGSSFRELPNSATVYSETYLWNPPGGNNKIEVACLSLPAPALDSYYQPHYEYYMQKDNLDAEKYEKEMEFLFKSVEKAVRDNKDDAFCCKGIKRLVFSKFGQGAFLGALSEHNQGIARNVFWRQMAMFLERIENVNLEIVMSEYSSGNEQWPNKMIIGDIIKTAREGDLIINAWDPHSAPGNGNDADHSFDGAMGKGSGILLTQTSWLNMTLRSQDSLVAIK